VSDDRTFEATPRRLARARQQFGRPSSQELTAACAFGAVALGVASLGPAVQLAFNGLWGGALEAMRASQQGVFLLASGAAAAVGGLGATGAVALAAAPGIPAVALGALRTLGALAPLLAAVLVALAVVGGTATALQRGMFLRLAGASGDFAQGLPRPRGVERWADASWTLAKWLVLLAVLIDPWSDAVRGMLGVWQRAPHELLPLVGRLMVALLERAAVALAVLGVIDFAIQQVTFRRRLRMSRQELQEERRATESDPHASAERRRRARDQQLSAAMLELSDVDALVCDLDGRAIALRRERAAPQDPNATTREHFLVWLKADGDFARRIRTEAAARELPIAIDAELTNSLLSYEINEPLPPEIQRDINQKFPATERA
jgi:flagellar biosynthetic protein FlhB